MDPLQTYIDMMDAILSDNDWEAAKDKAICLLNWFNNNGAFPGTVCQRVEVWNQCKQVAYG